MLTFMFLESFCIFFHVSFVHATNITVCLFILISEVVLLFKSCQCIEYYTTDNLLEHHLHENHITYVEQKSSHFKLIHIISYSSWSIKNQHTINNLLTCLFREVIFIDNMRICTEWKYIKNQNEHTCKYWQNC